MGDGTGRGIANSRFFVYEADEYRRHFLAYHPDYMVMTNIDFDHPDYFKDIDDVTAAFQTAADQTRKGLFVWGDDERLANLKTDIQKFTYGLKETDDYRAVNIKRDELGAQFDVLYHGDSLGRFTIRLFGEHNIMNSLAVIGVAHQEGLNMVDVANELVSYQGTKRRFAETDYKDVVVIDDYAHHPTEMKATLQAARQKFPDMKLVAIFQPHTYSRTKQFAAEFAEILRTADKAYVTPIFGSARESTGDISSEMLVDQIGKDSEVIKLENISDLTENKNSVMVFMGAGDIQKYETAYEKLL